MGERALGTGIAYRNCKHKMIGESHWYSGRIWWFWNSRQEETLEQWWKSWYSLGMRNKSAGTAVRTWLCKTGTAIRRWIRNVSGIRTQYSDKYFLNHVIDWLLACLYSTHTSMNGHVRWNTTLDIRGAGVYRMESPLNGCGLPSLPRSARLDTLRGPIDWQHWPIGANIATSRG